MKESSFRLHVRKLFAMRVVRHWHRMPTEARDATPLEVYSSRLDGAVNNLVYWEVFLTMAGG